MQIVNAKTVPQFYSELLTYIELKKVNSGRYMVMFK